MKKAILIYGLLLVVGISCYLLKDSTLINYQVVYLDSPSEEENNMRVCVINNQGQYEIVNVIGDNSITSLISLYNEQRNALPLTYQVGNYSNFIITNIDEDNHLIEINDFSGNEAVFKTLVTWSLYFLGIYDFTLSINNQISTINSLPPINVNNAFQAVGKPHTVFFIEENSIIPITYYHQENKIDFICSKVISDYNYKYDIYDKTVFLDITSEKQLSQKQIKSLYYSLNFLEEIDSVVVTKDGIVL